MVTKIIALGFLIASLVLPETITPDQLRSHYDASNFKILVVPGHNEKSPGAVFRGLREYDLNVEMAANLVQMLKLDSHLKVYNAADLSDYLKDKNGEIEGFLKEVVATSKKLTTEGFIKRNAGGIQHVRVSYQDALKLYGVNKWANDNGIDLVLHVHFNDYPRKNYKIAGEHSGFSIYIPERQLPNHRASSEMAKSVLDQMKRYFPTSDLPLESSGIIEDQDLIAVGAKASLYGSAVLVEYGYIYESQFAKPEIRGPVLKELAYQTYLGLKKYFEPQLSNFPYDNFNLPHQWTDELKDGVKNKPAVFALQLALSREGVYPPAGFSDNDCPANGNFGKCTQSALKGFQKKYELKGTGILDSPTLVKLNALY